MSSLTYSTTHASNGAQFGSLLGGYARNVAHAGHLFLGALVALKPAQVERRISRRQRLKAVIALYDMAKDVDASMPGLATELRMLAGRD